MSEGLKKIGIPTTTIGAALLLIIPSMFMMLTFVETLFADKGGKPNDNAVEGDNPDSFSKPCDNYDNKRHVKQDVRIDDEDDRNPGNFQAHSNSQDDIGVGAPYC